MANDTGSGSARSSFERLKALDTLPDLSAQLREANQLCDHSARAEMISRWLLGKLKSEAEVRRSQEAWDTLLSAFRLLSPQKVATLFTNHDLLEICKSPLQVLTNGQKCGVFLALVRLFKYLIEAAAGSEGTQLKAVLSVSAVQAASFLDAWIDSALTLVGVAFLENGLGHDMLQPIFDIWNLRKRSPDENEIFAKHCFLSASRLLPLVNHYVHHQKLKRKQDDGEAGQFDYKQLLESMLARHIFVPARTAFFKAQEATETKARRQVGSQNPTFVLQSMIEPLHNDDSRNTGLDEGQLAVLSDLFDVAVRCLPRLTPKQRTKEKPWLDAVFKALLESMRTLNSNSSGVRDAVREMLSIAKQREVALSEDILDGIIKQNSGLDSGVNIDWKMISRVLQIDRTLFSDERSAAQLLTEITKATLDLLKESNSFRSLEQAAASGKECIDFLRKQVVSPVMKAFADERKLAAFVDLWAEQINDDIEEKTALIWADLAADFAPLVEEFLTDKQTIALFDQYCNPIEIATGTLKPIEDEAPPPPLKSSVVVADAILSGVRSEVFSNAVYERCGQLLKSMLGKEHDPPRAPSMAAVFTTESQPWTLMTKAFELWFPAWAMMQSDAKTIAESGARVVRSNSYSIAKLNRGLLHDNAVGAAEVFVSCVRAHLHEYDLVGIHHGEDVNEYVNLTSLNLAAETAGEARWTRLLQFPNLIADLDYDENINLISDCIKSASSSATDALQALTTCIFQQNSGNKVNDTVETFLLYLLHRNRPDFESEAGSVVEEALCLDYQISVLRALSILSPDSMLRAQREKILNVICKQQQSDHEDLPKATTAQTLRLVVLNSLMKVPNATCNLAVDPEELWKLTKSVVSDDPKLVVPMVEELTGQLSTHLLATQDQERSRSMLIAFAESVSQFFLKAFTSGQLDDGFDATLAMVLTLIVRMEAASKEELKSKFKYRNSETINSYLKVCLGQITYWCTKLTEKGLVAVDLEAVVKILLAMPEDLLQFAESNTDSWEGPLNDLMTSAYTALHSKDKHDRGQEESSASTTQAILVDSFCVACKISSDAHNPQRVALARDVACLHLTPVQREAFMTAFALYVQKLQSQQYVELLDDLLRALRLQVGASTASILPLLQVCTSNLDKAKLESIESPLPRLLSSLLSLIDLDPSVIVRMRAATCIATVLKGNASLINQYCIEMTLSTVKRVLDDAIKARRVYLELCNILTIILLQYRSRLHGRFHLVDQVFQSLLSRLFQPANMTSPVDEKEKGLTIKHAKAVAELLSLFCEPPQFKRPSQSTALVDEARKEQAYVGKSVQYVLHHYCSQILNGTLGPGMKEALRPGLWSMVEAMEMGEAEGVKTLSAAMNNSERAVLRDVYDDWRRFGRWHGA